MALFFSDGLLVKGGYKMLTDLNCLLAGLVRLFGPLALFVFWHKRTGARLYPAVIAFMVCFPTFFVGTAIRSGFSHDNPIVYYIQQGLLFGVVEEGVKYLMFRFLLEKYDNRKDAVTYGIGHSAYEGVGGGMACLVLIGLNRAAPEIFWFNLWTTIESLALTISLTVLIFYGIRMRKSGVTLPVAILVHALCNAVKGIFIESSAIVISAVATACVSFVAYRCWRAMYVPFEQEL